MIYRKFLHILAMFLLFQPLDSLAASYPVDIAKGFIITTAEIDGQTVNVILDSGAPGFVLNEEYFTANKRKEIQCAGINGSFTCGTHTIRSWKWLGAEDGKTKALVSDLTFLESATNRPIHAIVGLSVLSDYYVSIDFDNQSVTIQKEIPEFYGASISTINYIGHLPVISCKVNNQEKILGLDTGSASNYLFNFEHNDKSLAILDATPVLVIGTDNQEDLRHRLDLDIQLSNEEPMMSTNFIVDFNNKDSFSHDEFDGILGQDFLRQYNLIIHQGKQKLILIPRHKDDIALQ